MKRVGLALVALVLVTSCSGAPAVSTGRSSPRVNSTDVPFPPMEPSPLNLAAGCRLPIYRNAGPSTKNEFGFLDVCTGGFTSDPSGGWGTYLRPSNLWVPAGADTISPDGLRYVYVDLVWRPDKAALDPRGVPDHWEIRIVGVIDKVERLVTSLPMTTYYRVVKFNSSGVYLTQGCAQGCPAEYGRLWLLDPDSGRITKVTDVRGSGWIVRGKYAWANSDLASEPSLASSTRENPPWQRVFRLDLTTGETQVWASSQTNQVLAFLDTTGMPVIIVQSACQFPVWPRLADCYTLWDPLGTTRELYRLTSPTHHDFVVKLKVRGISSEPEGTWISNDELLYLYTPPRKLRAVASTLGFPYFSILGPLGD